jgi:hypothetical protein
MKGVLSQHQTQRERIQNEIVKSNQKAIAQLEQQMTENKPLHDSLKKAVDTLIARESNSTIESVCSMTLIGARPAWEPQIPQQNQLPQSISWN